MSSSQGANNVTTGAVYPYGTTTGYAFNKAIVRDGSDWTRYVRESRIEKNYISTNTTDNKNPQEWWAKFGNQFRLDYLTGKWKCTNCAGGAYNGGPVGST